LHKNQSIKIFKVPRRILVVITLRIGDVLLATPVIRSMKLAWPHAEIDVLVFKNTEGVLRGNPDIHRVITVPMRPGFWEHLRLNLNLFRRYDLALTGQISDRATIYTWIAGKVRIGVQDGNKKNRWKQRLLSGWAKYDNLDTHTVLTNLGLVDLLEIQRSHQVVAAWNAADEKSVVELLQVEIGERRFAVLHMSPKYPYKMWHKSGWVELAVWLNGKGIRCVLTGSGDPDEMAYVEGIFRSMPSDNINLAGKLSLAESAFLLSRANCYVGPDTALTHMAAALGTPTVALFGPSSPVKWGPWPKGYEQDCNPYRLKGTQRVGNVLLIQGGGECVPCMEEGCERHINSLSDCLQKMPAAIVIEALSELMSN
jgi:heptosyltransferase-3